MGLCFIGRSSLNGRRHAIGAGHRRAALQGSVTGKSGTVLGLGALHMKRLKDRIDGLPLILCGPILRRTQPDSVTVWLALRKAREVSLEIFAIDGAGERSTAATLVGQAETIALGDNLHIVAVTASGGSLEWGQCYGYDLNFGPALGVMAMDDNAGLFGNLFTHADGADNEGRTGIYANDEGEALKALTFPDGPKWPSFVLPPDVGRADGAHPLDRLRVCHGSCRKPHGEGFDALPTMDLILEKSLKPDAGHLRPHMLFLTGDQIYADDVADALLALLSDAGEVLLGWPEAETLPGKEKSPGPGHRAAFGEAIGLTSMKKDKPEYGKSHLLYFAEYAAMYLFAWSDVLWPDKLDYPWSEVIISGSTFDLETERLQQFQRTLPKVRRALANVPVYMIFDDHEITDDWNLTLRWVSCVLDQDNPAGRRVIMNGLLAYAIFQAWGNTPWLFEEGGAGRRLLDAATRWRGKADGDEAEIIHRLNIPTYQGQKLVGGDAPAPIMRWHYSIQTPNFLCLVLDTRTMRGFPGGLDDRPELLNDQGFALQIDQAPLPPEDGITVVVATTNVFSEPLTELGVEALSKFHQLKFDPEAAAVDPDLGDAWAAQSPAYERLLARLADRAPDTTEPRRKTRIVIATGDIHYGFAVRSQYWGEHPYRAPLDKARSLKPVDAVFAQFTASSFRNEIGKTRTLHERAFLTIKSKQLLSSLMSSSWVGWQSFERGGVRATPLTLQADDKFLKDDRAPDWRYRIDYIKDDLVNFLQGIRANNPNPSPSQIKALAQEHRKYAEKGAGRIVVGRNNIGDIRFHWGDGDDKAAFQHLWWLMTPDTEPAGLTKYKIPLGINENGFPKPPYPGEEAEK